MKSKKREKKTKEYMPIALKRMRISKSKAIKTTINKKN
jgi:hypothetical protein